MLFLYFQHHYSSLQCHMIFRNHNNETFLIIINVVLHYIFMETDTLYFSGFTDEQTFKRTAFIRIFYNIMNVFTVASDRSNASV